MIGDLYQVTKADPSNPAKMPAIGVVVSKSSSTVCKVQVLGEIKGIYSGLTPGAVLVVGSSGQPSHSPGLIFQSLGVALSDDVIFLFTGYGDAAGGGGPLIFGADSVGTSSTSRYLFPGYAERLAETGPLFWTATRTGTLKNLYVRHGYPSGNGATIVYRARKNTVATPLLVSLTSTGVIASNNVDMVMVSPGDQVDLQVVKTVNIGASPRNVVATMEVA
jgi:hypothetical protein